MQSPRKKLKLILSVPSSSCLQQNTRPKIWIRNSWAGLPVWSWVWSSWSTPTPTSAALSLTTSVQSKTTKTWDQHLSCGTFSSMTFGELLCQRSTVTNLTDPSVYSLSGKGLFIKYKTQFKPKFNSPPVLNIGHFRVALCAKGRLNCNICYSTVTCKELLNWP